MGHNSGSSYKFPHLYRKRGGDRDVSARATHLKAATGIVPVTTIERKQMSNKTSFKRIALAVVVALGFGAVSAGPSNAVIQAGSTLSIASTTGTAIAGAETATAVLTFAATSTGANGDSLTVSAVKTSGGTPGGTSQFRGTTAYGASSDSSNALQVVGTAASAWADAIGGNAVSATFRFDVIKPTTAGTYTYTFYPSFTGTLASGASAPAPVSFTLTVTAANTKPAAAQSSAYIVAETTHVMQANQGDSTIVITAGSAGSYTASANLTWVQRTSDSGTALLVKESVTAVISGVGALSIKGSTSRAAAVTAEASETITVWADGRGGVGTITLTTTSMTTWATKTITFFSTAKSAALSAAVGKVSKTGSDSTTALRVVLKDANSTLVAGSATNMYVHSSDTRVVSNGLCSVTVSVTTGYGNCSLSGLVADSGTTKIKVANYAYESVTTHASLAASFVSPEEVSIQVVGAPKTIKASFDKSSYNPGQEATVTLTLTDGLGNVVDTQTVIHALTVSGPDYNVGTDMTDTASITFNSGKKTYTYVMPSTGQKVTLSYTGGAGISGGTQTADSVTVTVVDPAEEAANSALDAAQEATDAAIAATDAAVLAQESADAAAVAAEAAAETAAEAAAAAKAAVDAVTALSAEVAKLLTQLATLQKLMNRIAKKVGVKV